MIDPMNNRHPTITASSTIISSSTTMSQKKKKKKSETEFTKDFVFKRITSSLSLIVSIGLIIGLFSLALFLRLSVFDKNYRLSSWSIGRIVRNERHLKNYDFLLNETILSNYEKVVENIYLDLAKCRFRTKPNQPGGGNLEECEYQINAPRLCPDEKWINYKHYCFKPIEEKSTWLDAQSKCSSLNSSLMIIKDGNKQSFVSKSGLSLNITREAYFIGLRRVSIANDNWIWSDGNVISYNNWNFGEPNNQDLDENCAEMIISSDKNKNGKWNDISCSGIKRDFICERNLNIDYNDLIFDLIKNKNITEDNLFELTYELFKLTELGFFTNSQIANIATIFAKISSLPKITYHTGLLLFQTLNNVLNSPETEFQSDHKSTNSLLNSIERIVRVIVINETNTPYEEMRLNLDNLIVRINDMALISDEDSSNEFSYLPLTQEFIRKFHSYENNLASVLIKSKLNFERRVGRDSNSSSITTAMVNQTSDSSSLFLTDGLNRILSSTRLRISVVYFKTMKLFQSNRMRSMKQQTVAAGSSSNFQVVAQPALSVNIFPLTNSSLVNNKNIIEFEINLKMSNRIEAKSLKCAHWRYDRSFNDGFWSNDGCKYIHYDASSEFHKCVCNYTTHFALLFNVNPNYKELEVDKSFSLRPITYIALFLSNVALLTTIITYIIFNTLRHGLVHKALILLAFALLSTNNTFALTSFITPSISLNACLVLGILFHYLLLASFMAMLVLLVVQYLAFVKIFDFYIRNFVLKSILFSFGLSILIPITIICIEPKIYINSNQSACLLSGSTLYVSFVGPIAAVALVQLTFFALIAKKVWKRPVYFKQKIIFRLDQIYSSLACFIIISVTWLLGFPLLMETGLKILPETLFSFMNVFQGFGVFAFHLILSKAKRQIWNEFVREKSDQLRSDFRSMSRFFNRVEGGRSAFRQVKNGGVGGTGTEAEAEKEQEKINHMNSTTTTTKHNLPDDTVVAVTAGTGTADANMTQQQQQQLQIQAQQPSSRIFTISQFDVTEPHDSLNVSSARSSNKNTSTSVNNHKTSTRSCLAADQQLGVDLVSKFMPISSRQNCTSFLTISSQKSFNFTSENDEDEDENDANDETTYYDEPSRQMKKKMQAAVMTSATTAAPIGMASIKVKSCSTPTPHHDDNDETTTAAATSSSLSAGVVASSYFADDISARISRLNDSLRRIKSNEHNLDNKRFSPVEFKIDDLSNIFFDQL